MKSLIVIVPLSLLIAGNAFSQAISFRMDTVMVSHKPYVLLTKGGNGKYLVRSLAGKGLMTLHDSRTDVNGKPGYVLMFSNGGEKCMVLNDGTFPKCFIAELVKAGVIDHGEVNVLNQGVFERQHPMPAGYIDVEDVSEGDRMRTIHR